MLYVIVVLLAVVILMGLYLWDCKLHQKASKKLEDFWFQKWMNEVDTVIQIGQLAAYAEGQVLELNKNYAALEQGRDEESEAYEMQFLSFKEEIGALRNSNASYIDDLRAVNELAVRCYETCLPSVVKDPEEIELITRLAEEHAG